MARERMWVPIVAPIGLMQASFVAWHRRACRAYWRRISQQIRFPDGPIVSELESFGYEYTRTGVRYAAAEGLYDDCVCALALAVMARERMWVPLVAPIGLTQASYWDRFWEPTAQKLGRNLGSYRGVVGWEGRWVAPDNSHRR